MTPMADPPPEAVHAARLVLLRGGGAAEMIAVAAPYIRAQVYDEIRQLADRAGAVCTSDEGTSCFFSALIPKGTS